MASTQRLGSTAPSTLRPLRETTAPDRSTATLPTSPSSQARNTSRELSTFEPSRVATRPQTNDPSDDTVAVLDTFTQPVVVTEKSHGEMVQNVLMANSSVTKDQVRRVPYTDSRTERTDLDGSIEDKATNFLLATTDGLKTVRDDPGKIRVVNQSMGQSKLDLTLSIWSDKMPDRKAGKAAEDKALMDLAAELKLPPDRMAELQKMDRKERRHAVFQALADKVDSVLDGSAAFKQARADHAQVVEQLGQKGIVVVVAAGNEGEYVKRMEKAGFETDADFPDSALFHESPTLIVVGASTGKERMAKFSTPSNYVSVAADGTKVEVASGRKADGTSFAAPQVSALIAELSAKGYSPEQIRGFLKSAAKDTKAPSNLEGDGIIDMKKARERIRSMPDLTTEQPKQTPLELKLPVFVRP
ncbi:S8 family serine peptidase [Pyxidicoccus sp. 3LG]